MPLGLCRAAGAPAGARHASSAPHPSRGAEAADARDAGEHYMHMNMNMNLTRTRLRTRRALCVKREHTRGALGAQVYLGTGGIKQQRESAAFARCVDHTRYRYLQGLLVSYITMRTALQLHYYAYLYTHCTLKYTLCTRGTTVYRTVFQRARSTRLEAHMSSCPFVWHLCG